MRHRELGVFEACVAIDDYTLSLSPATARCTLYLGTTDPAAPRSCRGRSSTAWPRISLRDSRPRFSLQPTFVVQVDTRPLCGETEVGSDSWAREGENDGDTSERAVWIRCTTATCGRRRRGSRGCATNFGATKPLPSARGRWGWSRGFLAVWEVVRSRNRTDNGVEAVPTGLKAPESDFVTWMMVSWCGAPGRVRLPADWRFSCRWEGILVPDEEADGGYGTRRGPQASASRPYWTADADADAMVLAVQVPGNSDTTAPAACDAC